MTIDKSRVLETLVSLREESDRSITVTRLSDRLDSDPGEIETALAALCEYEFVEAVEGSYRPTRAGREFLDLDVEEGEFVVVETTGESEENAHRP